MAGTPHSSDSDPQPGHCVANPDSTPDCTLGLSWATLMGADFFAVLDAAGAAGFDTVSISPGLYRAARSAGHTDADLCLSLDCHHLTVAAIDPLISAVPGAPRADRASPRMRRLLAATELDCFIAAEALGAPMVAVATPSGTSVPIEQLADAVGGISSRAALRGLQIGIEVIANSQCIGTLEGALEIVRRVGLPNLGIVLDAWQLHRTGVDADALAEVPATAIAAIQLSDDTFESKGRIPGILEDRLVPGDGAIPLAEMLAALVPRRPGVDVTVEVINSSLQQLAPRDVARRVGDAARAVLARVPSPGRV